MDSGTGKLNPIQKLQSKYPYVLSSADIMENFGTKWLPLL